MLDNEDILAITGGVLHQSEFLSLNSHEAVELQSFWYKPWPGGLVHRIHPYIIYRIPSITINPLLKVPSIISRGFFNQLWYILVYSSIPSPFIDPLLKR